MNNRSQQIISLCEAALEPEIVSHIPSNARRLNTVGMDKPDREIALGKALPKERNWIDDLPHAKEFKFSSDTHTYNKVDPYFRAQHNKSYADVAQANKEREEEFHRERETRRNLRYEPIATPRVTKEKTSFASRIFDKFHK